MIKLLLLFVLTVTCVLPIKAQDGLMIGGGINYNFPTNNFGTREFGFNSVANSGFGINTGTVYFLNPALSLGSELAYSYFPKDELTWNQSSVGTIDVNYQILNLSAQGNFYFSDSDTKPYIGVVFGFYYLRNMVNFNSNYQGSTNDASVSYVSNIFKAGFAPEFGFGLRVNNKRFALIAFRYTVIPNFESEYLPYERVTINPHGNQNYWSLSAKIFFRGKR